MPLPLQDPAIHGCVLNVAAGALCLQTVSGGRSQLQTIAGYHEPFVQLNPELRFSQQLDRCVCTDKEGWYVWLTVVEFGWMLGAWDSALSLHVDRPSAASCGKHCGGIQDPGSPHIFGLCSLAA